MLSYIGLGRGLLSLGLVLILSWSYLGLVLVLFGLILALTWSCLVSSCLVLVLS